VVVCLRDLNISSQLSKSQYVRILRVENERLECLTLDGQLAGTKTVITRVSFPAKYRNDAKYSFTRTQYPIRVATDYVSTDIPRDTTQSRFKLPAINRQMRPPTLVKRPTPLSSRTKPHISSNPSFKLPGLPVFKAQAANPPPRCQPIASPAFALDRWDDFLESGTQIARELSAYRSTLQQRPSHGQLPLSNRCHRFPHRILTSPWTTWMMNHNHRKHDLSRNRSQNHCHKVYIRWNQGQA
jgi:hypothetical protein